MDPVGLKVGISWILTGLVMIGVSIPLVRGMVGRNRLYGVRFPESFQSEEAWLAINRFGGQRMIRWAAPLVVVGVCCLFLPLHSHRGLALCMGFGPLVLVLAPALEAWRFARRYRPGE